MESCERNTFSGIEYGPCAKNYRHNIAELLHDISRAPGLMRDKEKPDKVVTLDMNSRRTLRDSSWIQIRSDSRGNAASNPVATGYFLLEIYYRRDRSSITRGGISSHLIILTGSLTGIETVFEVRGRRSQTQGGFGTLDAAYAAGESASRTRDAPPGAIKGPPSPRGAMETASDESKGETIVRPLPPPLPPRGLFRPCFPSRR